MMTLLLSNVLKGFPSSKANLHLHQTKTAKVANSNDDTIAVKSAERLSSSKANLHLHQTKTAKVANSIDDTIAVKCAERLSQFQSQSTPPSNQDCQSG